MTIATLRALGERLVGLHGQHENQGLVHPEHQRELLDAYGRLDPLIEAYRPRGNDMRRFVAANWHWSKRSKGESANVPCLNLNARN